MCRMSKTSIYCCLAVLAMVSSNFCSDAIGVNYDESKIPAYTLPDPLVMNDGTKVTTADQWNNKRRPEILKLFTEHMFGQLPPKPKGLAFKVIDNDSKAFGGKATRKQVQILFTGKEDGPKATLLLYIPNKTKNPPVFLTNNFKGNHTVNADPAIKLAAPWTRKGRDGKVTTIRGLDKDRGARSVRWAIDMIVDRGYAFGTIYYYDVDPDFYDNFKNGAHALFPELQNRDDNCSSISLWAWGLSRCLDYVETDDMIDHKRAICMGHSRLGKTSLWAGATDQRFAMVISNDSGCGGAALSRRAFGETTQIINNAFPHWFCKNYKKYNGKEDTAPIDQHMLIALMAPRPVYVASAVKDRWADPHGEFLSCFHANPVYKLLGTEGLLAKRHPKVNKPTHGRIGYHVREGKHDVTDFDWKQYMDFADKHLK